jgi:hypothetical protein
MSAIQQLPWAQLPNDPYSILTGTVRLSWPSLARPRSFEGQKPKYQATLIFPKAADLTALKTTVALARDEKWGARVPANLRFPLRDGAEKVKDDGTFQSGYGPEMFFMNVSSERQPQLVDNLNKEITDEATIEKTLYAGCYVRALIRAYCYDVSGNKGVTFGLNAVQFIGHGEPLGGAVDATKVFTAVAVDTSGLGAGNDNAAGGGTPAPSQSAVDALFG